MTQEHFHQRIIGKYQRKLDGIQQQEGRPAMLRRWMLITMLLQHERALAALKGEEFSVPIHIPLPPSELSEVRFAVRSMEDLVVTYEADRVQPLPDDEAQRLTELCAVSISFLGVRHWDCSVALHDFAFARNDLGQHPAGFGGRIREFWGERFNGFCYEIENSRELRRLRQMDARNAPHYRHWRLWVSNTVVEVVAFRMRLPKWPQDDVPEELPSRTVEKDLKIRELLFEP